ncbi:hypothetical protein [Methylobacterium brachythecii]|uniref:Uncharacterized protein n=1 Tax=Methylobacterium brachythecii TaxID=1176177 RepID=A0A7W6F748_9HYPH|nr:hypothetical protein [Methylobacterium brachythecii]MBB3903005.1 hypothetical protein [Methylobacterium brachythecii]GLS46861.1 hypothetical protein GCM10007884_48580 [Methylobacterium brachythecii]
MSARSIAAAFLLITASTAAPTLAQSVDQTGTGGGPASTLTAPNTSAVGQTKPPGAAAAPDRAESREARSDQMKRDDKIMKGICIGCGTK